MQQKKIRVLVLVKDQTLRREIANFLDKKKKFNIETATDAKEADDRVKKTRSRYEAVVIDSSFADKTRLLKLTKDIKQYFLNIQVMLIVRACDQPDIEEFTKVSLRCFSMHLALEELSLAIEASVIQRRFEHEKRISNKLHELSIAINSATNLQEIFEFTCKAAVEILNVHHSGLVQFQQDLSKGVVYAEYPPKVGIKGRMIKVKDVPLEEKLVKKKNYQYH